MKNVGTWKTGTFVSKFSSNFSKKEKRLKNLKGNNGS